MLSLLSICGFVGCIMPAMASSGQGSERLNAQLLVDSIPGLIHTARPDGYLDYFNKPWLEYLGVTLDKVAGWNWTAFVHPEDVEGIVAKWRACLATGEVFEYETRVRSANGEYRWMFHRKVPLRDANGNIVKWYGSSLDIEERKAAEEKIREQETELRKLLNLIPHHVCVFGPDASPIYANQGVQKYFGVDADQLVAESRINFVHPDDREHFLAERKKGLLTGEAHESEARLLRHDGTFRSFLFRRIPLKDDRGHILRWYGTATDIEDRKRAEEKVKTSEFYLAEGQRLAHMGSWAFDPNGFYYWSPELFRMHGLDPAGKPPDVQEYLDRVHPHDRESMADLIKGVLEEASPFDATKRIVRPNGEIRYIRCVGAPVVENQSPKKYVGSALDVTEHELLTQELRRREAYLTGAQRLSHTGSFGWKPESGEIVWSDETYRIFECDRAEKPTLSIVLQRIHPQDRALAHQVIDRASQTGTDFEHEYRLLMADGRVKQVHAIAHALQDTSGNREFVGAVTDITGRKAAEEALRSSEAYLAEAQRLSHTGSWAWSPDQDIGYWSEECSRVLGFDPKDGWPRFEEFFQRLHPDDQPGLRELTQTAIREKAEWETDYRIVHPDGSVRDIHVLGHPVLSTSGDLVEFVGTVIDVTQRKRAEEERRRSEMELRQMLDLMPQHLAVLAPDGTPLHANRVALEYLGVDMDRWRTETSRYGLLHPEDREKLLSQRQSEFLKGTPHEFEARMLRHDGIFRWFLFRLSPLKDERGDVTRWYGTGTDIEDRKQAEDRLRQENVALREEIGQASMFEDIVGTSSALKSVLSRISKVAPSDSTVLITGETGTGKELVARAIHRRSDRASRAFVSVNCAAIPRDLIASELFGHEKGAFTGATLQRLGRFELANGGTIFLDEVGELPVETQIALLRVLQEHEFERVGGSRRIRADVRVIAATNRDLQAAINAGSFRSDLFYRLHVFPIEIPSLRERREDIPLLVEYFIDRYARKAGKNIKRVNKKTLELLQLYPWPGNIRELQNVIERSVILCETEIFSIDESWLPKQPSLTEPKNQMELPGRLLAQEKEMIEAALKESRGQIFGPKGAAAKLGIPRSTLESKIRSLKINKNRFRTSPET
jgi:PAS domain S-box-containing protein